MSDVRIYTTTSIYEGTDTTSEFLLPAPLADSTTTRMETICGKVVRYMLTGRGTDMYNLNYGSYLTTYSQISEAYLPRLQVEILEDLARCTKFIQLQEAASSYEDENLERIKLIDLVYDSTTRNRIDLYLEVVSTYGNSTLLTVPVEGV